MSKKIADIKYEFEHAAMRDWDQLFDQYREDERSGVAKLILTYQKKQKAYEDECRRLEVMQEFERKYGNDFTCICGIDEAGRGPLAGPVVAGAVVLPRDCRILYLNDSKKLSAKRREELFDEIKEKAVSYGIGMSSPERIDQINILQATYEAMTHAVQDLQVVPDLLLNDAVTIPQLPIKQLGIIKGDGKSVSIAAASIVAKVTRDQLMTEFAELYPEYGFEGHKGYGSSAHIEALKKYGPCPIHRRTFIKNFMR
ncbi:MAG: ribonuclease HII [Eubacterium sp.]|nr:ribonuclease HII [Eubacterium sp.]